MKIFTKHCWRMPGNAALMSKGTKTSAISSVPTFFREAAITGRAMWHQAEFMARFILKIDISHNVRCEAFNDFLAAQALRTEDDLLVSGFDIVLKRKKEVA